MALEEFEKRARALRRNCTSAEERLWDELRGRRLLGWKFRRQHSIDRFIVDFVTLSGKLIVEVDGDTHSTESEIAYDENRTAVLEALGFHVFRVTNTDVFDNMDGVLEAIINELAAIRAPD